MQFEKKVVPLHLFLDSKDKTAKCLFSSVDRALAFQAEGRGFEPRLPLQVFRPDNTATAVLSGGKLKSEKIKEILTNKEK